MVCGLFFLLAAHSHVDGDVHPTRDLAMCALHMLWASVEVNWACTDRVFHRLGPSGAICVTNRWAATVVPVRLHLDSMMASTALSFVKIVRFDSEGLTGVTTIGCNFLAECNALRRVNLRGFRDVTSIGNGFMRGCAELRDVDLAPLSQVTSVGEEFFAYCTRLRAIDLSPLACLTTLCSGFLNGSGVLYVDCRPLGKVSHIGDYFLAQCPSLREVNLSSSSSVSKIGSNFLWACPSLHTLDLSALVNVTELHWYGLLKANNLWHLTRPAAGMLETARIPAAEVPPPPPAAAAALPSATGGASLA